MTSAHLIGVPGDTGMVLVEHPDRLPTVAWCGVVDPAVTAGDLAALCPAGLSMLPEGSHVWYGRPGLSGHRGTDEPGAWSTRFVPVSLRTTATGATIEATDKHAGLGLVTDVQAVTGGLLRIRHVLTNTGSTDYMLQALDVVVPTPDHANESLDFTSRWARERIPQRRPVTDGLWLRENRRGKTGFDAATVLTAGTPGFGFGHGQVWGVHVAWSGNHVHRLERVPLSKNSATATAIGGGELLFPGELTLSPGASYQTPWLYVGAADDGLDGLAARFHGYLRSTPAHPRTGRPVTLNVWEAVYFDHRLPVLRDLADRAAGVGVERFVLDDGWFGGRRHDRAGLGDWTVAPEVWPDGLAPVVDHVHSLGMQFGLWFEPEMTNTDSDLFRAHPEWILATGGRHPPEERHQQILDLAQRGAYQHVLDLWTAQLVPPEYLGAHVSAPRPHPTHRTLPLDFRAATALFGHFGVEWDLTTATDEDLATLARWITLYKTHRDLLHTGRTVRLDSAVDDAWVYGVVAPDRSAAIMAYAQLDELPHEPPRSRIPGLSRTARYHVKRIDPATWPAYGTPAVRSAAPRWPTPDCPARHRLPSR